MTFLMVCFAMTESMKDLNDPKFKGMEKLQHTHRNPDGTNTVIHYVRDPATGNLMDFKFK